MVPISIISIKKIEDKNVSSIVFRVQVPKLNFLIILLNHFFIIIYFTLKSSTLLIA